MKIREHPYDLFWFYVDPGMADDECWVWRGATSGDGYGNFKGASAHRVAYECEIGPIPEDLELDHLCRVRNCVNPAHLEPVTRAENVRRGYAAGSRLRTHCKHGHPFSPSNTYWNPQANGNMRRQCRTCNLARAKTYDRTKRAR
jgi:hypothetical protein